jgi:HEAT repeat protein
MDWNQLWQDYKEIILLVAGAVTALLGQKILPGLWTALVRLGEKLRVSLGRRLSAAEFERRYLAQLCEEHRFLKVRGIHVRSPVAVELEQVYVSLTLAWPSRDGLDAGADMEAMQAEALPEGVRPQPSRRPGDRAGEGERLSVGQTLQRCPERLTILGGPGTGKTTLLNYLALKFARGEAKRELGLDEKRLPILIPLRELSRSGLSLTVENLPALCTTPELAQECPAGFFKKRLQNGDCIVLLDGIDEVTTEDERRRVAEQIDDLVTTHSDNRFVVTSRPAGYGGVALVGFTQLDICDFADEDVEAFARYWCLAVELAVRGAEREVSETVVRRKAEREAGELVAVIRANDRVRRLTVNPLLLTIVAVVHRYRATLPNRRVDLYDECTQVLLGYWDEAKGIAGQLDPARKRRVLEPLAYWMHERGIREAERAQVEQAIAGALPTVGEEEAKTAEFLKDVRERSGLLVERGLGIYGFSHLTFQEYLTASYLIDQGRAGREALLKHLHDPWWLEATLLYAGMRNAAPLLEAILAQRDDLFKNNLFLAVRCLMDVVNVDPQVEDEVLARLLTEFRAGEFEGLRVRAAEALVELGRSPGASKVTGGLFKMLGDEAADVRGRAAVALGELRRTEPRVIEALLGRLDDEDADVRGCAVSALGRVGQAERRVIEALLERLSDGDAGVRGRAAFTLGRLGRAEPKVVEMLLGLLGDEEASVRGSAANALGRLEQTEPGIVEALVERLGDEAADVRESAAYTLSELEQAGPEVIEALVKRLSDEAAAVRESAAYTLGELEQVGPEVIEALVEGLNDEEASVRESAADALGKLGRAEPEVVEALLGRLGDEATQVRESVADALSELERAEPRLFETLLDRLGDEAADVRGRAADALGRWGRAEPEVVKALINLLGDETADVRESAALALGRLGRAEPGVIKALVNLLADKAADVRASAASALGQLGRAEPGVVDALIGLLGDEAAEARWSTAFALRQLGRSGPEVIGALLSRLGDEAADVRGSVALALDPRMRVSEERIQPIPPQAISTLRNLLADEREAECPMLKTRSRVKDVAWRLLRQYTQQTGERIYRHGGE